MPLKKWIAITLTVILVVLAQSIGVTAETDKQDLDYAAYSQKMPSDGTGKMFTLDPTVGYSLSGDGRVSVETVAEKNALVWQGGGSTEWKFNCEVSGYYKVEFVYYPLEHKNLDVELALALDGAAPYKEAETFFLPRVWKDSGPIKQDSYGNDYNPTQVETGEWLSAYFCDANGNYDEPLSVYISEGEHTLTLTSVQEPFALNRINFIPNSPLITYKEYLDTHNGNGDAGWSKIFEAESAYRKSDQSLLAQNDRSSIYTTPFSYKNQRLNTIGGGNWNTAGEWIEWKLNVPKSGFYRINFRYSQSYTQGLPANRRLYINGEVPFAEADNLRFNYSWGWDSYSLNVQGEEALFWLNEGDNILRLEVTLGEVSGIVGQLETTVRELNEYYRRIIMITGSTPDTYRDYNLEQEIPNLSESFKEISSSLKEVYDYVGKLIKGKGDNGNILKVLSYQLENMVKNPASIPFRLDSFSSNISSLSSWAMGLKNQSLDLDSILVAAPDSKEKLHTDENFFQSVKREFSYFLYSFVIDYNSLDADDTKDAITVWINTGRDQFSIIRRMIDDMFTPQYSTAVSLKLTKANAMQAFLSGNAPDVMLNVERGQPVNLALRGALYDLTRFSDYQETVSAFSKTAAVPFSIGESVYALPQTELFYMMFVRQDILSDLGVSAPQTWDEFYAVVQKIQLNGMRVGIPYTGVDSNAAVDSGIGEKNLFSAFLMQRGGSFYTKDLKKTALDTTEAVFAFEEWTNLYTKYDFDLSYNFFNRFRTGEMPIGIALYSEYNQLRAAAPEIYGLWEMLPIPGTVSEDGTVNRSQGGSGTACVITSTTKHADSSWQFIKWWTGEQAQTRFANDLEASMGVSARYATANLAAQSNIPWTTKEYAAISQQMQWVSEVPVAAGSYYLARGIDNAFRETVYDGRNAKEALNVWSREINDEMQRKQEEFFNDK